MENTISGTGKPDPYAFEPEGLTWTAVRLRLMHARGDDRLLLLGGLAFLVSSFLPWYSRAFVTFSGAPLTHAYSGWRSGALAAFSILIGLLGVGFAALKIVDVEMDLGEIDHTIVQIGLSGVSFLMLMLNVLAEPVGEYGLYAAVGSAAVMALTSFRKFRAAHPG